MDKKRKAEEKRQRRINRKPSGTGTSALQEIDASDDEELEPSPQDHNSSDGQQ